MMLSHRVTCVNYPPPESLRLWQQKKLYEQDNLLVFLPAKHLNLNQNIAHPQMICVQKNSTVSTSKIFGVLFVLFMLSVMKKDP